MLRASADNAAESKLKKTIKVRGASPRVAHADNASAANTRALITRTMRAYPSLNAPRDSKCRGCRRRMPAGLRHRLRRLRLVGQRNEFLIVVRRQLEPACPPLFRRLFNPGPPRRDEIPPDVTLADGFAPDH